MTKQYEYKTMTIVVCGYIFDSELEKLGAGGFRLVGSLKLQRIEHTDGASVTIPNGTQLIFERELGEVFEHKSNVKMAQLKGGNDG